MVKKLAARAAQVVVSRRLLAGVGLAVVTVLGTLSLAAAPAGAIGPAPTITNVNPNSLPQGVASVSVTLTGTNFVAGAVVTSHSGITATATFISSTQLDLLVDVGRTVPPGAYNMFVTNPDQSVGSCSNCLAITVGTFPTVTSINPSTLPQGASNQPVTLMGTNFQSGARVTSHNGINISAAFVSPTQLNLTVSVQATVASGPYDVFVTNPDNSLGSCINCLGVTLAGTGSGGSGAGSFVGIASLPDGSGYWMANSAGGVFSFGNAQFFGSLSGHALNAPVTHIVSTPDGLGYWLVAGDGGTFTFGDAGFFGSMGGQRLNAPVVDIAPTPSGRGYWLVASDGGIFSFGDAQFFGSTGNLRLNKPVVGMAADQATGGYWLVATDGGIFSFNAPFFGSTGNLRLNKPVNGMATTVDSGGYWLVASDGGIFSFGNAAFHGSAGNIALNAPVIGMAADWATGGYWLGASDGGVFSYGAPFYGAA